MHSLHTVIGETLLAMYSRLKNPRGLRGLFVDAFIPQLLSTQLGVVEQEFGGKWQKFLAAYGIKTLEQFLGFSQEACEAFDQFMRSVARDPEYLRAIATSPRIAEFAAMYIEGFGHKSIDRMGSVWFCCEQISALAAKSLEWSRPGCGFIELSTRIVDMSVKGCYPIQNEISAGWNIPGVVDDISRANDLNFRLYRELAGDNFDGVFPQFLRATYAGVYADAPKALEAGVIGETCDVLGNLLPCGVLTSVGVHASAEAVPGILRHLLLDGTPENIALVGAIVQEASVAGCAQFARHYEPTEWELEFWRPSHLDSRPAMPPSAKLVEPPSPEQIRRVLMRGLGLDGFLGDSVYTPSLIVSTPRGQFDKLPRSFELETLAFQGVMSFRSWRDLSRQGFCTHNRSRINPCNGFYEYDKPHPPELDEAFADASDASRIVHSKLIGHGVPAALAEYPLIMGTRVGFTLAADLRELEFCAWQRTKQAVNHEVRQVFLMMENEIRAHLPWWEKISRANMAPAFVFARGSKVAILEPDGSVFAIPA